MTATASPPPPDARIQPLELERERSGGAIASSSTSKFPNPRLAQVFSEEFIPGIVDGAGGIVALPLQQGGRPITPVDDIWTHNAWSAQSTPSHPVRILTYRDASGTRSSGVKSRKNWPKLRLRSK